MLYLELLINFLYNSRELWLSGSCAFLSNVNLFVFDDESRKFDYPQLNPVVRCLTYCYQKTKPTTLNIIFHLWFLSSSSRKPSDFASLKIVHFNIVWRRLLLSKEWLIRPSLFLVLWSCNHQMHFSNWKSICLMDKEHNLIHPDIAGKSIC